MKKYELWNSNVEKLYETDDELELNVTLATNYFTGNVCMIYQAEEKTIIECENYNIIINKGV